MTTMGFKLFISGDTKQNFDIINHLGTLFDEKFSNGKYDLEVVNILNNTQLAESYNIIATPTLVKYFPLPAKMVIGNFSNTKKLLSNLNLA